MPAPAGGQPHPPPGAAGTGRRTVLIRRTSLAPRGRLFVSVGVVSLLAGQLLGVVDLQRAGILLVVLPIPAWAAVRQARAGLRVGHSVIPARLVVGERAQVQIHLANPNSLSTGPLRIVEKVPGGRSLRFSVAGVRGRHRRTVAYPLPELARGRHVIGPALITVSDPFAIVVAESGSADTAEVVVQPQTESLPNLLLPVAWRAGSTAFSHSVGVGGSDDESVREYRHGDDLRKIHWRSTARAGTMMVRQEERPWHGESVVALDCRVSAYPATDQGSSAAFEWAVSAAASIARHLLERSRRVSVVCGDGQVAHNDARAIMDLLAELRPAPEFTAAPLAAALGSLGRDASAFAVLAGSDHTALADLLTRTRTPGSAVALLLKPWTWRNHAVDDPDREAGWNDVADGLLAAGWRVVGVRGGDSLVDLWPTLLAARTVIR
jgi:uncharacterized protein (DUF58 family)